MEMMKIAACYVRTLVKGLGYYTTVNFFKQLKILNNIVKEG